MQSFLFFFLHSAEYRKKKKKTNAFQGQSEDLSETVSNAAQAPPAAPQGGQLPPATGAEEGRAGSCTECAQ